VLKKSLFIWGFLSSLTERPEHSTSSQVTELDSYAPHDAVEDGVMMLVPTVHAHEFFRVKKTLHPEI
jgi:hypothetical protein